MVCLFSYCLLGTRHGTCQEGQNGHILCINSPLGLQYNRWIVGEERCWVRCRYSSVVFPHLIWQIQYRQGGVSEPAFFVALGIFFLEPAPAPAPAPVPDNIYFFFNCYGLTICLK